MKKCIRSAALACILAGTSVGSAQATLTTFQFAYSGAPLGNTAAATGSVTLNLELIDYLSGPDGPSTDTEVILPSPAVTDLNITVTGASAGNGAFSLHHFYQFRLSSPAPLDFTRELVGQPLPNGYAWGPTHSDCTKGNGPCGDFNFWSMKDFPEGIPPDAVDFFHVWTAGGEIMRLTSLLPVSTSEPVPEPASLPLAVLALACLGGLRGYRKPPSPNTWRPGQPECRGDDQTGSTPRPH